MTLDEVAREAIRYTLAAYHLAGDRGRIDELVETFAADGVLELPSGRYAGRPAIHAVLGGVGERSTAPPAPGPSRPGVLRHHLTTSHVRFAGPAAADVWSYFLVISAVGVDHSGRYVDRFVATPTGWLIASRRVVVEWAAPDSVVGARMLPQVAS